MLTALLLALAGPAQPPADPPAEKKDKPLPVAALKPRLLGPAVTSGRVVGFAVNPNDRSHYFVAVASGGVWKTTNAGTTWTPVFDGEGSYSVGCVVMDPRNPNVGLAWSRSALVPRIRPRHVWRTRRTKSPPTVRRW